MKLNLFVMLYVRMITLIGYWIKWKKKLSIKKSIKVFAWVKMKCLEFWENLILMCILTHIKQLEIFHQK